jgi:hypothetical protein
MICGRPRVRPPLSVLLPVAASTDSPTPTVTIVGRRTGSDGNKTMISDNYIDSNLFFHPHRVLVGGGKGRTGFKVVAVHKERMYYFSRRKKSKLYEINKHTEHATLHDDILLVVQAPEAARSKVYKYKCKRAAYIQFCSIKCLNY